VSRVGSVPSPAKIASGAPRLCRQRIAPQRSPLTNALANSLALSSSARSISTIGDMAVGADKIHPVMMCDLRSPATVTFYRRLRRVGEACAAAVREVFREMLQREQGSVGVAIV
jgi:hypothetical protein